MYNLLLTDHTQINLDGRSGAICSPRKESTEITHYHDRCEISGYYIGLMKVHYSTVEAHRKTILYKIQTIKFAKLWIVSFIL